jgi:hypothetical protein
VHVSPINVPDELGKRHCRTVGVLESEMHMAGRRRKGEVGGKDGLRESKRIERSFKSIGFPSLECSKTAKEKKDLSWVRKHG